MSQLFNDPPARAAVISDCGKYRYQLFRIWSPKKPLVVFIMLNPSTADASQDDPTIRRCIGFAQAWGYGGIAVVNLFAWRATDPQELLLANGAIGPQNDYFLQQAFVDAGAVVAAWGAQPVAAARAAGVQLLAQQVGARLLCLGTTKEGHPRHPLYVAKGTPLVTYRPN
jgi:hypothetical protein